MAEQKHNPAGYAGRIQNAGTQVVKAPMQNIPPKKGAVHTGKQDLRR